MNAIYYIERCETKLKELLNIKISKDSELTVGIGLYAKEVEYESNKKTILSIWKLGCQYRFKFVRSIFYKDTSGAILIFNLTREATYTEIRNWELQLYKIKNLMRILEINILNKF